MTRRGLAVESLSLALADLPATALELIELIGWAKTEVLIRELGGVPYPIPRGTDNPRGGAERYARLEELVGGPAAQKILARYRGTVLSIPTCRTAFTRARDREIRRRCDEGATLETLAIEFRLTTRRISEILKIPDTTGATLPAVGGVEQLGLF